MEIIRMFRRKENGSVTLEAAVFMPVFILFLAFLIFMVKFALTDIALNRATSETAKQIATQVYPVKVTVEGLTSFAREEYGEIIDDLESNKQQLEAELTDLLGADGLEAIKNSTGELISSAQAMVFTPLVQNNLEEEHRMKIINKDNVKVKSIILPVLDGSAEYVEIITTYEIDLPIPFIEDTFLFQKKAVERAWIGS